MHPASLPIDDLLSDCQIRRQRRSGPGGQHRNKVETGVFIEHRPTGFQAEATEQRSQAKNQEKAIFRLRLTLAVAHRSPPRNIEDQEPSALWKSRLQGGKIRVNEQHHDFPAILAECLDVLASHDWEPSLAKETLKCSTSQLIKLIKKEPTAYALVNRERADCGKGKLH